MLTLNPDNFSVTNTFLYEGFNKIEIDEKNADQFLFEYDRTVFTFKTAYRDHLLCQLFEGISKKIPNKLYITGPIECERLRKNGTHIDCKLSLTYYGIIEHDMSGKIVQEYKWVNVSKCGADESASGFFFEYSGRTKIFLSANIDQLVSGSRAQLKILGRDKVPILLNHSLEKVIKHRTDTYSSIPAGVSVFDVNKVTRRSVRPMPRQLHISEAYIKETDSSGFQTISFMPVDSIYAIVRSWSSQREFRIEYNDGSSRVYTSTVRDTLLAMLLDVCHATGNVRVIVTGEVSDGLRLMPRFAEEDYQASFKDAFFGASSIEAWYLSRLVKLFKPTTHTNEEIIQACREFNANVPCPGLNPNTDMNIVKIGLTGVVGTIQSELLKAFQDDRLDNSRELTIILQTLYRLIPCIHGFKAFVEVKEYDTRQLLLQLLRFDHDFVHYWTLEVLMMLCRCPLNPRNMQQEYVNKYTLLSERLLRYLTELMYFKTEEDTDTQEKGEAIVEGKSMLEISQESINSGSGVDGIGISLSTSSASALTSPAESSSTRFRKVAANPNPTAHIPASSLIQESPVRNVVQSKEVAVSTGKDSVHFTPNALLVIGAASLLESLLCSRRDTTSPELINQILNLLAERSDVLINMLRSTSFLIMENASILMFTLLKNRPTIAPALREMALSDCLVLKNFYNGIFSPSASQRFISRFLIATWMSGSEKVNPAKGLLLRMIPSGLVEYLKFATISEDHRKNLDMMEDEFYSSFSQSGVSSAGRMNKAIAASPPDLLQSRMRKRIAAAIKEKSIESSTDLPYTTTLLSSSTTASSAGASFSSPLKSNLTGAEPGTAKVQENYRIMFHVMTQDHKLPDLIWNEQTRLELRTALETEIKEYDKEQRLQGNKKIAWNYQQFFVRYESLREELQVGPIYIRYFLEAGDTFLKSLENPNHIVLFEKLFRRVLVNVEHQPSLSILCVRCLTRLYEVCGNIIGTFDDMLIMVKMLEQASNLELQQYLLDLLVALSSDEHNLRQLLDMAFVNTMIKYVTLAHINPDQIGNALARATAKVLLIQNSSGTNNDELDNSQSTAPVFVASSFAASASHAENFSDEEIAKHVRRSLWVPEDVACPKVWFVAPPSVLPPPKQAQRGPYRVSELLDEIENGHIGMDWVLAALTSEENDDDSFDALIDTGRWKNMNEYFQLKLQMLYPGKAIYSPAQVAAKSLTLLQRLAAIHRSSNSKGLPFYPIPMSKKLMSDPNHLNIFAQLLLSNDAQVVDNAAELLRSLVEYNTYANSKLYLSGAFYFAARYTGNNYLPIATLLHLTHLRQSFHDSAASVALEMPVVKRSILGRLLPPAMIAILHNYGPEKFASIHTGEFDTPEVIWNATARRHLVEMINQHLGDFPARLRQYTMSSFEYVPIATIHYAALDKEIYVHEYYLRNLCDEVRFPSWPISDPLLLLRESIQRWREEMAKGIVDSAVGDAKKLLKLDDRFDNRQLRKAYKNLAREYHPDKNPQGRDMFEKIQLAYELLSKVEMQETETNLYNVYLLMQTQNILYRRYPERIGDQKYPAYPLAMEVLRVPSLRERVQGLDADLLLAATRLMYFTTSVSPLNAKEFVKVGCVGKLYELFAYAVSLRNVARAGEGEDVLFRELLIPVMKTFTAVANAPEGREAILSLCPNFAEDMYGLLSAKQAVPLAVEYGIEVISRCASSQELQRAFIAAGVIWRLVPCLMDYDGTYVVGGDTQLQDESQRMTFNPCAANTLAIVAAKALGRLGGYMHDDLQTTVNADVQEALSCLLTLPLAKLLRNRRPWELLQALNDNVETTTKIWNVTMRKELVEFLQRTDGSRLPGSHLDDLTPANTFVYSNLRDELCVHGVYVRIFNRTTNTDDITDPSQFCHALLQYLARKLHIHVNHSSSASSSSSTSASISVSGAYAAMRAVERQHLDYAVEALRILAEQKEAYIPQDIADAGNDVDGMETVLQLLDLVPECGAFASTAKLLGPLFASTSFVTSLASRESSISWRVLKVLCTVEHVHVQPVWAATESLVSQPIGLQTLLDAGAIARLLGILLAVKGYVSQYQSRLAAMSLLSKMLWNPSKGPDVLTILSRFLPRPLVMLLHHKAAASSVSLQAIDQVSEHPELVWTAEMQGELRTAIVQLLGPVSEAKDDPYRGFLHVPNLPADYMVVYRQLANEIYLGNVYIRIFLQQPTFRLSHPVFFMEKVTDFWESSFVSQVPAIAGVINAQSVSDSTEIILGKEDFLSLLTSCMICVIKAEPTMTEHLLSWGFVHKMIELMQRAVRSNRRGAPLVCILRLLQALIGQVDVIDHLATGKIDILALLKESLDNTDDGNLPKDATIMVELLKRIVQSTSSRFLNVFIDAAKRCNLVNFLLDRILAVEPSALSHILHPAALKIHAVDCVKSIFAADCEYEESMQAVLALHSAWREYRDQSHDLFLSVSE